MLSHGHQALVYIVKCFGRRVKLPYINGPGIRVIVHNRRRYSYLKYQVRPGLGIRPYCTFRASQTFVYLKLVEHMPCQLCISSHSPYCTPENQSTSRPRAIFLSSVPTIPQKSGMLLLPPAIWSEMKSIVPQHALSLSSNWEKSPRLKIS
jgi:hypothetical protein